MLGIGSNGRDRGVGTLGVQTGKTGLAADAGNERIAGRWLGNGVAALIEPSLEVRVRPRLVKPVTGVVGSLLGLLGGGLVVVADSGEERIALAGLGNGDALLVGESLKLGV